jgi:hypothetical protein
MQPWTFGSVLSPLQEALFLKDALGRAMKHIPGDGNKFSQLITWTAVNGILSNAALTYPRLRLWKGKQEVNADAFQTTDSRGTSYPNLRAVNLLMSSGATLTIESIEQLHQPILRMCQAVESSLGVPVETRLCINTSKGDCAGLRWYDHDLIALQVTGKHQWAVYGETLRFPTSLMPPPEPTWAARWDRVLDQGEGMYLPRGWWHNTTPTSEPSLILAINFRMPTGLDIATRVLGRLESVQIMRMDYPLFAGEELQSKYITQIQCAMVREIRQAGLALDFFHDVQSMTEPRRTFSWPWAAMAVPTSLLDCLVITPLTRFRPNRDIRTHESVSESAPGAGSEVDEEKTIILESVFDLEQVTVQQLVQDLADRITRDRLLEVLSELLKEGRVAVRPVDHNADSIAFPWNP